MLTREGPESAPTHDARLVASRPAEEERLRAEGKRVVAFRWRSPEDAKLELKKGEVIEGRAVGEPSEG